MKGIWGVIEFLEDDEEFGNDDVMMLMIRELWNRSSNHLLTNALLVQEGSGELLQVKVKHIPPTSFNADGVLVPGSKAHSLKAFRPCMSILTPTLLEKGPSENFGQSRTCSDFLEDSWCSAPGSRSGGSHVRFCLPVPRQD